VSTAEFRDSWLQRQEEDIARAQAAKQSQDALTSIAARYRCLSPEERRVVDDVLVEQLGSDNEIVRFVALALIEDFRITSALPSLRRLAESLETQHRPGAPYEWAKVNRIIGKLTTKSE